MTPSPTAALGEPRGTDCATGDPVRRSRRIDRARSVEPGTSAGDGLRLPKGYSMTSGPGKPERAQQHRAGGEGEDGGDPEPGESAGGASPRRLARIAGALYLINIVGGAFAIGIVQARLFTADPAATAHNIQSHELLYRSGLAAHIVVTVTNVPLALIFYELFKRVSRRLALLDAFFILVATAIEAAGLVNQFAPLVLLGSDTYVNALPAAQRQALAALPWALSDASYAIYTVFFGLDLLCLAYLVLRSRLLPSAIGVLLVIDGLAYLIYSFTHVLVAPGIAAGLVPWIQLPAPVAEGALSLWLLVRGVNTQRWTTRPSAEPWAPSPSAQAPP
jgi:hypothetical protein